MGMVNIPPLKMVIWIAYGIVLPTLIKMTPSWPEEKAGVDGIEATGTGQQHHLKQPEPVPRCHRAPQPEVVRNPKKKPGKIMGKYVGNSLNSVKV